MRSTAARSGTDPGRPRGRTSAEPLDQRHDGGRAVAPQRASSVTPARAPTRWTSTTCRPARQARGGEPAVHRPVVAVCVVPLGMISTGGPRDAGVADHPRGDLRDRQTWTTMSIPDAPAATTPPTLRATTHTEGVTLAHHPDARVAPARCGWRPRSTSPSRGAQHDAPRRDHRGPVRARQQGRCALRLTSRGRSRRRPQRARRGRFRSGSTRSSPRPGIRRDHRLPQEDRRQPPHAARRLQAMLTRVGEAYRVRPRRRRFVQHEYTAHCTLSLTALPGADARDARRDAVRART